MCMSKPKAAKPAAATAPVVAVEGRQQNSSSIDRSRQRGLSSTWTRYENQSTEPASTATAAKADKLGG